MSELKSESGRLKKTIVALTGGLVLIIGIIAIPYPGPGWLIVFAGLAILAREFPWAERALKYGRHQYDRWNIWIKGQNRVVQSITFLLTLAIIVLTIWLLNGYGLINNLLNLNKDWLNSPFVS